MDTPSHHLKHSNNLVVSGLRPISTFIEKPDTESLQKWLVMAAKNLPNTNIYQEKPRMASNYQPVESKGILTPSAYLQKTNAKAPDFKGKIMHKGEVVNISAWWRKSQYGEFLTLSVDTFVPPKDTYPKEVRPRGDDVIIGEDPAIGQLMRAYDEFQLGVVGVKEVSEKDIQKYSSLQVSPLGDRTMKVTDMIEKPSPDKIMSLYSILGRCVLPPQIFGLLEHTLPGAGGELQLTDAMKTLARLTSMVGVDFTGIRYDMGDKLGILKANVEVGLKHEAIGNDFRSYLLEMVKGL